MHAKHYENPTMLSRVTAKNVGDVFFWDTLYILSYHILQWVIFCKLRKLFHQLRCACFAIGIVYLSCLSTFIKSRKGATAIKIIFRLIFGVIWKYNKDKVFWFTMYICIYLTAVIIHHYFTVTVQVETHVLRHCNHRPTAGSLPTEMPSRTLRLDFEFWQSYDTNYLGFLL